MDSSVDRSDPGGRGSVVRAIRAVRAQATHPVIEMRLAGLGEWKRRNALCEQRHPAGQAFGLDAENTPTIAADALQAVRVEWHQAAAFADFAHGFVLIPGAAREVHLALLGRLHLDGETDVAAQSQQIAAPLHAAAGRSNDQKRPLNHLHRPGARDCIAGARDRTNPIRGSREHMAQFALILRSHPIIGQPFSP